MKLSTLSNVYILVLLKQFLFSIIPEFREPKVRSQTCDAIILSLLAELIITS